MHFFDSSKKGQKFEHQPTQRKLPTKPITPPPERSSAKLIPPLKLYDSLQDDRLKDWREKSFASSSTDHYARKDNVPFDSGRGEERKDISQPDTVWKTVPKGSNNFCFFHLGAYSHCQMSVHVLSCRNTNEKAKLPDGAYMQFFRLFQTSSSRFT